MSRWKQIWLAVFVKCAVSLIPWLAQVQLTAVVKYPYVILLLISWLIQVTSSCITYTLYVTKLPRLPCDCLLFILLTLPVCWSVAMVMYDVIMYIIINRHVSSWSLICDHDHWSMIIVLWSPNDAHILFILKAVINV